MMNIKVFVVLAVLASLAGIAAAVPPLPQELSGQVTIGGQPAAAGTVIEAMIDGSSAGSIVLTERGSFGGDGVFDTRLIITGLETQIGETVTFKMKGYTADQTAVFTQGSTGYIILAFPSLYSTTGGGGNSNSAVPAAGTTTDKDSLLHDGNGAVLQDTVVCSSPGAACLSIPEGTIALTAAGTPLDAVNITPLADDEVPPAGALFSFAGYAFECTPEGATFSPPITLTITLTAEEWEALDAGELSIQWYNPETGAWETLETAIDATTHTVSAQVSHFTVFGLFQKTESGSGITVTSTVPGTTSADSGSGQEDGTGFPWLWSAVIVIVIIVAVAAFVLMKKH